MGEHSGFTTTDTVTISGLDIATDVAANNAKITYPSIDSTKVGYISVTQAVNLDEMESDITINNGKVSYPGSADATELNILDGATLTTTELNYVDGVTSSIQTQLNTKYEEDDSPTFDDTLINSSSIDGNSLKITSTNDGATASSSDQRYANFLSNSGNGGVLRLFRNKSGAVQPMLFCYQQSTTDTQAAIRGYSAGTGVGVKAESTNSTGYAAELVASSSHNGLDCNDTNLKDIRTATFNHEQDAGSKTASFNVDFDTDQNIKATLTANTMTATLQTPVGVGSFKLKLVNGGLATLTWAAQSGSVLWAGGDAPTLTSSGTDIIAFYWDGTNWYGVASLDFS